MFFLGGLVVGAVIGGVRWYNDYSARSERYEKERTEKEREVKSKLSEVENSKAVQSNLVKVTQENKVKLDNLKQGVEQFQSDVHSFRLKLSKIKDECDDMRQQLNVKSMDEDFMKMGFK